MRTQALPIVVRYGTDELDLEGDANALQKLAAALIGNDYPCRVTLQTDGAVAAPYEGIVQDILIEETSELVLISRLRHRLLITGRRDRLHILARNIANVEEGNHLHVEHFEGHAYLRKGSVPLVVECRESPSTDSS